jgi:hypothetical protein
MHNSADFAAFAAYLAEFLPAMQLRLKIPRAARFCGGVDGTFSGIEAVVAAYDWKARWIEADGSTIVSQDWASTKLSLARLRRRLRQAAFDPAATNDDFLAAAGAVLAWGGDRNAAHGAMKFLRDRAAENDLKSYLLQATDALRLDRGEPTKLGVVREMNSMLSKVHALLADDGLPIYDSRVAFSIAMLAERYGRVKGLNALPEILRFPTFDAKRHVAAAIAYPLGEKRIYYTAANRHAEWSRATWTLGRLIRQVLGDNPKLLAAEGDLLARCHAFEAALFMLGYDARCLFDDERSALSMQPCS